MASLEELAFEEHVEWFELRRSTWELMLEQCPPGEVEEIKRVLGTSLVEQVIDLQEEVSVLLEIWRQMKDDADVQSSCGIPLRTLLLPEPPHVRERLVQEIKFFVNSLQRRSSLPTIGQSSPRGRLVEYVNAADVVGLRSEGHGRLRDGGRRPLSEVSSRGGRSASLLLQPRPNGQTKESQHSLVDNGLGGVSDQINATSIDMVVKKIRAMLEQDCEHRRLALQFLQKCVEGEQYRVSSAQLSEVPALSELREFGSQLEKEYLLEAKMSPHSPPARVRSADDSLPLLGRQLTPLPPKAPRPQGLRINRASKVILRGAGGCGGGVDVCANSGRPAISNVEGMSVNLQEAINDPSA